MKSTEPSLTIPSRRSTSSVLVVERGQGIHGHFAINRQSLRVHRTAAKNQAELLKPDEATKEVRESWTQATTEGMTKAEGLLGHLGST